MSYPTHSTHEGRTTEKPWDVARAAVKAEGSMCSHEPPCGRGQRMHRRRATLCCGQKPSERERVRQTVSHAGRCMHQV